MKRDDRAVLNEIIDEQLAEWDGDVRTAATFVMLDVESLDGGGIDWAYWFLRNALRSGIAQVVSARKRSQRVMVGGEPMPRNYTTSGGGLASWLDVPVDELDMIIDRLDKRSGSLEDHAAVLIRGRNLAKKHNVATAAEAYAAEGITVTEVAA